MVNIINLRKLFLLFPFVIILGCIYVAKSTIFLENPGQLSSAITFDLLVSVPVIYFLIIRKRNIPNTTVVPVFILGIVVASIILPAEHQFYLSKVKTWFLPFLEIAIVSYIIYSVVKAFKRFRQNTLGTLDFFTAAKTAAEDILPKGVSTAFATELSMFYYGFIHWKRLVLGNDQFTYHKTTSTRMVLGVFVFLIIIEAFAVHLLLQNYSSVAAWILTILSIYGMFQIFGIMRSLSKRPMEIGSNGLKLKYSIMAETHINFNNIESVESQTKESDDLKYLSPFKDMEGHNVVITLKEPGEIIGFYGFKKEYQTLAIYLDEPKKFVERLNELMAP